MSAEVHSSSNGGFGTLDHSSVGTVVRRGGIGTLQRSGASEGTGTHNDIGTYHNGSTGTYSYQSDGTLDHHRDTGTLDHHRDTSGIGPLDSHPFQDYYVLKSPTSTIYYPL